MPGRRGAIRPRTALESTCLQRGGSGRIIASQAISFPRGPAVRLLPSGTAMRILPRLLLVAATLCFPMAAASAQHFHGADPAPQPLHPDSVPLWPGLRDHVHHEIATDSARAQQYFDQGLAMIYGFNHVEAVLSFQRAYRIDPRCAMCYWG